MVLACKYVDDVIIGCSYVLTRDMIKTLNIHKVVQPKSNEDTILEEYKDIDPYADAKDLGIFEEFEINSEMTVEAIAERVVLNREKYKAKYDKKKVIQDQYYN